MGTISRVLHRGAKPITTREFMDAVQATCPPRFPQCRGDQHRRVGLAISGGVDSMALAFLCAQIKRANPLFKISDNPISGFSAMIVDHRLREGSSAEARAVSAAVQSLGIRPSVIQLNWNKSIGKEKDPKTLPNLESIARKLRYRYLGRSMGARKIATLLLAHHEDDQYETVLMRLMAGHGMRGLRGMRSANDIPECYDMHRVYQSGFVDDQLARYPFHNMRPTKVQAKASRAELRASIDPDVFARELVEGFHGDDDPFLDEDSISQKKPSRTAPFLLPLDVEDGGITIYRPLLEFSKARLIATCVENNIPWFEDHTNHDPTLTTRNALRYLCKHHELPTALQKPAILQLAKRCDKTAAAQEAEAERLFERTIIRKFEPNVGTVLIQLPRFRYRARRAGSRYSTAWRRQRMDHHRTVAALLVQKLLALVSPERAVTPISNLPLVVTTLFPILSDDASRGPPEPTAKGFSICKVYFAPVRPEANGPLHWYLSRAPYESPTRREVPFIPTGPLRYKYRLHRRPDRWKWPTWNRFYLLDGRFWIRICNRLPTKVIAMPFDKEHAKPFRESLADDTARDTLAALLKEHAPAKVRYTLPGIYALGNIDWALKDQQHRILARPKKPLDDYISDSDVDKLEGEDENELYVEGKESVLQKPRLVALPTLGIHIPGIEHWVQWEVRYRKVDLGRFGRENFEDSPFLRGPHRHRKGGEDRRGLRRRYWKLARSERRTG